VLLSATGRLAYAAGPWDEETLWLHGLEALKRARQSPPRTDLCADEAGYYSLRAGDSFALIHCPRRFRHRPAHADLLHVDLWWRGVNVTLDPGSYSYNAAPPFEGALKETHLHNTVSVDGLDQMARAGRFLWLPWARGFPQAVRRSARAPLAVWEGSHDGYCRLPQPATHRRSVIHLGDLGWIILDFVMNPVPRRTTLNWLLPAAAQQAAAGEESFRVLAGGEAFEFRAGTFGDPCTRKVTQGAEGSPTGWRSRYYQHREAALAFGLETVAARARFWTHVGPAGVDFRAADDTLDLRGPKAVAQVTLGSEGCWTVRYEDTAGSIVETMTSA
jgi:asparagine synthase (glutamine-hydrolysing)